MQSTVRNILLLAGLALSTGAALAAEASGDTKPPALTPFQLEAAEALKQLQAYTQRLEENVRSEGAIPLAEFENDKLAVAIARSENLAEDGKYAEAATLLRTMIAPNLEADWKAILETKVEILDRWARAGTVDLANYRLYYLENGPEWFHERTKPIFTLWKLDNLPKAERMLLMVDFLEKRYSAAKPEDRKGQIILLQAIPYLPKVEPKVAALAILMAGNYLHTLGDRDGAEKSWKKVMQGPKGTPEWAKAVYNLGILCREKKQFTEAIAFFQSILDGKPDDKETGSNIMEPYRNYSHHSVMQMSQCYESLGDYKNALKYTEWGLSQYPYQTWCGNGADEAGAFIRKRIQSLQAAAAK